MSERRPCKTDLSDEQRAMIEPVIAAGGCTPLGQRPPGPVRDAGDR